MAKLCAHCKQSQPITEFHKNRTQPDGLGIHCKSCSKLFKRQARERGVTKKSQKLWYHRNKAHVSAYNKVRYDAKTAPHREAKKLAKLLRTEKKCSRCQEVKTFDQFYKNKTHADGYTNECRSCFLVRMKCHQRTEHYKNIRKQWEEINREKLLLAKREQRAKNPEKAAQSVKQSTLKRHEYYLSKAKQWREANRDLMRIYKRAYSNRRMKEPGFRLSMSISTRIRQSLNHHKDGTHWEKLLGYSRIMLMKHLEKQFTKSMTWENYGSVWEIDHKIPLSAFQFTNVHDLAFHEAWALKNLQPLGVTENRRKGGRFVMPLQPPLVFGL